MLNIYRTCIVLVLAVLSAYIFTRKGSTATPPTQPTTTTATTTAAAYRTMSTRAPVYFISHGGPPSLFTPGSKPYEAWRATGARIRQEVKSGLVKGLVCVSAHWEDESGGRGVSINSDTSNPLIYDFYNFPRHYYAETFHSAFSPALPNAVSSALTASSIPHRTVPSCGLDHGLWVPFKAMFKQEPVINGNADTAGCEKDGEMPEILQLSLPGDGKVASSEALGRALASLRDQGYAIVATGQPVHNLRAYMTTRNSAAITPNPFTDFLHSFVSAITTPISRLPAAMQALSTAKGFKDAHPTIEHFLPAVVATGAAASGSGSQAAEAAEEQRAEVLLELDEGPLGWVIVRWD